MAEPGKIYVNLVDKDQVAVVDSKTMKVIHHWPTAPGGSPVGMSMDRVQRRLFVGCRKPQKLIVMNADDGKVLADLPIGAGVDATQFDGDIFASCRDGTLAVARETSPGKFAIVQTVATLAGAKTMGLDPATHTLYLPTAQPAAEKSGDTRPAAKQAPFVILAVQAKGKTTISVDRVPTAVKTAFQAKFPTAGAAEWKVKTDKTYEAEFTAKGSEITAIFDAAGKWLETESAIDPGEIPRAVSEAAAKEFKECKVVETQSVQRWDRQHLVYELHFDSAKESIKAWFSGEGVVLSRSVKAKP